MSNTLEFKKKILAGAVASCVISMSSPVVSAQESAGEIEEVFVTGIRQSLISSMDTKRDASGVVDAINAQDIGKFPDSNLAESLQRIPGVSIDREGGEGQFVTVRGFGARYNVTTLNGRQLTSENTNRDFEFDTLDSAMISAISINKSGSATAATGGIGAVIDLQTARPFTTGDKIAASLKANYETLDGEASPQYAALYSGTFADDKFGILASFSHYERDSTVNRQTLNNWQRTNEAWDTNEVRSNANPDGTLYLPSNVFTQVQKDQRTRDNANIVVQFAPTEDITITADALYSDYALERNQNMLVHWFGSKGGWRDVVADENGTVTHFIADNYPGQTDAAGGGQVQGTEYNAIRENRESNTLVTGLNVAWDATDNLTLALDTYQSKSEYVDPHGFGNAQVTLGYNNRMTFDMNDGFLPALSGFEAAQTDQPRMAAAGGGLQAAGDYLDPDNLRPSYTIRNGRVVYDTIDQFKLSGAFKSDDSSGLIRADFGFSMKSRVKEREQWTTERPRTQAEIDTFNTNIPEIGMGPGNINCSFCGFQAFWDDYPRPEVTILDAGDNYLSGVSGSENLQTKWLTFSFDEFRDVYENQIAGVPFTTTQRLGDSFQIEEDIMALYAEADFAGELGGLPYILTTGLRYEKTDVSIIGNVANIASLNTQADAGFIEVTRGAPGSANGKSDYSLFLPNASFKIDFTDDLVGRAVYSKTITRPSMQELRPNLEIGATPTLGPQTATAGNPDLVPLVSDNIDLSLEWYYEAGSYASAGVFFKNVENFIASDVTNEVFKGPDGNDLTNPYSGDVITWQVTKPTNSDSATVDGFEVAVQHMFGETGFGGIVNATFVNSDAEYDNSSFSQEGLALVGLGDSYNLVGFYENDQYEVRVAYNFRDKFLRAAGAEPSYVASYGQLDLSASYNLLDNVSLFVEGINILGEETLWHGRYSNHFLMAEESGPRYTLGVRASF